ncbi:Vegetative incompatibility protein [Wickerhamomyces ciferrii]|uniref:Vegetative incompatibility protein n=1 Tax=Wickerhamomyces ciferrii (strain ATCC 14091 / BCRC 22168 / CBS 111 / JCM 3599 / NBRC 0793 / NRRL Y-1031 F-60-10) TaxID=1206466 RepID=K0KT94_WICCF|nr:Vegetative incompatibility protein [Wickerhamomyces ciferrii]CCH46376.1 Vegetative incompatibility protein [Wickerhamomyces ciferrii]
MQVMSYQQEDQQEYITNRINKARLETRQLYSQIDKVKAKIQDTTLLESSKQIAPLSKNAVNLKLLQKLQGHNNKIADIKWAHDSKSILSASQDGFLLIWDPVTGLKLNAVPLDSQWVLSCAYSPNGQLVASAGLTNNCTIYRIGSSVRDDFQFQQRIVSILKGHTCGITACDFVDNEEILTASGDMTCASWDLNKGNKKDEYLDHLGDVLCMDIDRSKGSINFVSGASDGYARIWDRRGASLEQSFFVSNSDVTSVKFFKDGNSIVTGSDDGIIRLFDLRADCELARYSLPRAIQESNKANQTFLTPNTPSPYGNYNLTQSPYSRHQSTASISNSLNSAIDSSGVTSLDFSSSGRLMYSCYTDHGCMIWDLLKAEIVGKLEGHSNRTSHVTASPNGLAVATASWDTTMRVYTPSYV